jgi:hypothetical protein
MKSKRNMSKIWQELSNCKKRKTKRSKTKSKNPLIQRISKSGKLNKRRKMREKRK